MKNLNVEKIIEIIKEAGEIILKVYNTDFNVDYKEDKSPLTIADQRANDNIVKDLTQLDSSIHFITEETKNAPYSERKNWDYTWIIDPLDGTKEFVKRNGEFTVNIALCHKNEIIFGMILVPVTGELFYAQKGAGSFKIEPNGTKKQLNSVTPQKDKLIVVASRSHRSQAVDDYVEALSGNYTEVEYRAAGSSLKLCLVAEGLAHIYPRLGPTMEWDTAAGHIIAQEAGATITRHDNGQPLLYNKENLLNPFFIVSAI